MVLSKRERYIGLVTGIVLALLLFDRVLYTPLTEKRDELDAQLNQARQKLDDDLQLLSNKRNAERRWADISRGVLLRDESSAQSRILNSVREWAQEAGMSLSSLKPERTEKVGDKVDLMRVTFRATGTGQMSQIGHFLYRIQGASLPVRITDLTLNSHGKEGTDDLTISLAIATIYLAPEQTDRNRLASAEVTR